MIKTLKSNRIITFFVLIFIIIFISNPAVYMQSCLNGISVWFFKVFPALFPFFIASRMLLLLEHNSIKPLDKFCSKAFKTNNSGRIFFLSLLSGYPIGAKLICDAYKSNQISLKDAKKMMSYCSVSGPMFIVGTVGIGVFKNATIGYILLLSHIVGAVINGIVFRKSYSKEQDTPSLNYSSQPKSTNILADSMYDSIISILIVAGYIVFAYVLIDLFNNVSIIPNIAFLLGKIPFLSNSKAVTCFLNGLFEMTRGLVGLGTLNLSAKTVVPISSFLIGFGGLSIFLQSLNFTKELQIKKPFYLFQKFCQGIWAMLISSLLVMLL